MLHFGATTQETALAAVFWTCLTFFYVFTIAAHSLGHYKPPRKTCQTEELRKQIYEHARDNMRGCVIGLVVLAGCASGAATTYWRVADPLFGVVDDVLYLFTTCGYLAWVVIACVSAVLLFHGSDYGAACLAAVVKVLVSAFLLTSAIWTLTEVEGDAVGHLVYVVVVYALLFLYSCWYLKFAWKHSERVECYQKAHYNKMCKKQKRCQDKAGDDEGDFYSSSDGGFGNNY